MDVDSCNEGMKADQGVSEDTDQVSSEEYTTSKTSAYQQDAHASSWKGWAELENDPDIFTTILQDWGLKGVQVEEFYDITMVFERSSSDTLGLIFLSKYSPTESNGKDVGMSDVQYHLPWFANQISRFSCGTVALMNVIMNSETLDLGAMLVQFKTDTSMLSSKDRGIELDSHHDFRAAHNSFATKLDRMNVDVTLKEDAQASKQKSKKAKRKKRRKRKARQSEEDDSGFHFVAYLHAQGAVWKLDGVEAEPHRLGNLNDPEITWTQIAAADIQRQMLRAQDTGFDFSLMGVMKEAHPKCSQGGVDPQRIREDWAPFIEHMIRLHAQRGDLASLLGL